MWCRARPASNQLRAVLVILLAIGAGWGAGAFAVTTAYGGLRNSLWEIAYVLLILLACGLSYFLLFTAVEADSPTINMVAIISKAGKEGISKDKLIRKMDLESYFRVRIQSLEVESLIRRQSNGKYIITGKGRLVKGLVVMYRNKVLGIDAAVR